MCIFWAIRICVLNHLWRDARSGREIQVLEKELRDLVSRHVSRGRVEVSLQLEAVTGEQGVELAREHLPALILMDIQLPGIDGYEATRQIKANPALRHIPIIAVTSYALSGDDVKAFEAGCDAYVSKPFSPRALLIKIREFLP